MKQHPKIVISAGGTGGHVFPGIAVADILHQRGCEVCWIGRADSKESTWVAEADIPFRGIQAKPLRGKGIAAWITMPARLFASIRSARKALRESAPDVVLTLGGYVSAPVGLAAKSLGIPLLVHEQNAVMGMTNRLLSKIAHTVLCAFPGVSNNDYVVVGNPVRNQLQPRSETRSSAETLQVAIIGGSQGAQFLNENMPSVLKAVSKEVKISVLHQTGEAMRAAVQTDYDTGDSAIGTVTVAAFVSDMATVYAEADLLIARAGAMTVAEVALTGVPTIFVPFPYAVDDHQTKNAQVLVAAQGAELLQQSDFDQTALVKKIVALLGNDEKRAAMSAALQQALPRHSAELVADYCQQAIRERG